jgi:hypothetical protein
MLQIVSGKFFSTNKSYETLHRGALYTNYRSFQDAPITIAVGRLLPSTGVSGLGTLTYEITEKIEYDELSPGTMVSKKDQEMRLQYLDKQARRVHSERLFSMSVFSAVIVAGLCFMAAGIPGGRELVIGGSSYLVGHSIGGRHGYGNHK